MRGAIRVLAQPPSRATFGIDWPDASPVAAFGLANGLMMAGAQAAEVAELAGRTACRAIQWWLGSPTSPRR
jgi:hypothetical protein